MKSVSLRMWQVKEWETPPKEGEDVFLSWDSTEIHGVGNGERNRQERRKHWKKSGVMVGGGPLRSCPSADPPDPPLSPSSKAQPSSDAGTSTCPYLACPLGVWGRWAWMAALDQLNSEPVPGTCNSSPAASQKSGGGSGGRRRE